MKEFFFVIGVTLLVGVVGLWLWIKLVDGPRARRYHQMEYERLAREGILIDGVRYYARPFLKREEEGAEDA